MNYKLLEWKEFPVDLKRIRAYLKATLSANYDGLLADSDSLRIIFFGPSVHDDCVAIEAYWNSLTSETFSVPEPITPEDQVRLNMVFGQKIIAEFGAEEEPNLLDTEQTAALIGNLGAVQMMLLTGAIATAAAYLQGMDFTGILSQTLIDKYILKMQQYLEAQS